MGRRNSRVPLELTPADVRRVTRHACHRPPRPDYRRAVSTTDLEPLAAPPTGRRARWAKRALVANLVAQIGIVVTGGLVRLTGSGLGCSTWPQCEPGQFAPEFHSANSIHPYIEFGNRTLTGVLVIVAALVVLAVWPDRTRSASFRRLALAPLAGVILQAVIGGITVLVDLHPAVVGGHMLISLLLIAVSMLLLHRAGEGDGPPVRTVHPGAWLGARLTAALSIPMLVLGVIVTGAGPHSGDEEVGYRFAVDPALMARFHALAVWLFVLALIVTCWYLWRHAASASSRRAAIALLAVTVAQGVIGYAQFFAGLPIALVAVHMLGAGLVTAATVWFMLTTRERGELVVSDGQSAD